MDVLKNAFFLPGLIAVMAAGVLSKLIVWRNYRRLLRDSYEMEIGRASCRERVSSPV